MGAERTRDPWRVVALAYEGLCTFEFGQVVEVFGLPRPELDPWYRFSVCAPRPGALRASGGVRVTVDAGLGALDRAGTILLPGWPTDDGPAPPALLRKLVHAVDQGARVLSICSGAFLLAETGLLDGRRATTHWRYTALFRERFPAVDLDPEVLFVDEGQLLTSAGSAAGLDLCLHLVRRDRGGAVANQVARRLVVPPHRSGDQRQYIEEPLEPVSDEEPLAALLDRIRGDLESAHTVASMARLASTSPRTFTRRFRAATGTTPQRWLTGERVQRAQELLESTELDLERIAAACGFGDAQLLRLHFKRHTGTPPAQYRRTFRERG